MTIKSGLSGHAIAFSGLSIERLRAFCLVAEAGSIVVAVPNDTTRQSQFSRQIKELEEVLGEKLFLREGKRLVLTEVGRRLALSTKGYFGTIEEIRNTALGGTGDIHLGGTESVIHWHVMPHLSAIMTGNPGFRFQLHTMRTQEAVQGIKDGRLDLAVVRSDAVEAPLAAEPVGSLDFAWVVPRSLLPSKSPAGIRWVKELPMALLTGDGRLMADAKAIAERNHVKISVKLLADNFSLLADAIQNGGLAAVLPTPAAATLSKEQFATIRLVGMEKLRRDLSLVYHSRIVEIRASIKRVAGQMSLALRTQT